MVLFCSLVSFFLGDGFGVGWFHSNVSICPPVDANNGSHRSHPLLQSNSNYNNNNSKQDRHSGVVVQMSTSAAVFKDTQPAWNNANLREICMSTRSHCIMAHVRAASKGTGISQQNCHPFKVGRLLFCHNGRIGKFAHVRRKLLMELSDEAFDTVRGTTDSEAIFALLLTYLGNDGHPSSSSSSSPMLQTEPFGHKRLVAAMKRVLRSIERLQEEASTTDYSTLNFSLTDGETLVATRFCDQSPDIPPPSLYFAFGDAQQLYRELTAEDPVAFLQRQPTSGTADSSDADKASDDGGSDSEHSSSFEEKVVDLEYRESTPGKVLSDVDPAAATFIVASNPLTRTHTWHPLPKNSVMWCTRGSLPELRLLKRRAATMSFVLSANPHAIC
jgi:predicted glutamine amidotransferase